MCRLHECSTHYGTESTWLVPSHVVSPAADTPLPLRGAESRVLACTHAPHRDGTQTALRLAASPQQTLQKATCHLQCQNFQKKKRKKRQLKCTFKDYKRNCMEHGIGSILDALGPTPNTQHTQPRASAPERPCPPHGWLSYTGQSDWLSYTGTQRAALTDESSRASSLASAPPSRKCWDPRGDGRAEGAQGSGVTAASHDPDADWA